MALGMCVRYMSILEAPRGAGGLLNSSDRTSIEDLFCSFKDLGTASAPTQAVTQGTQSKTTLYLNFHRGGGLLAGGEVSFAILV